VETAAARFARDWSSIGDDRKTRGLDDQPVKRKSHEYVDTQGTGNSAVTGAAPQF
jgi:hypothetical protein